MNPIFLTVEEVLILHGEQILLYGGSPGLRDAGGLDSAVQMPSSGIGDAFFHADLAAMAGAYLYHIAKNHPFVDGNKRTGLHAALVFLDLNGFVLEVEDVVLEAMVLKVASGKSTKESLAEFFRRNIVPHQAL